MTVPFSATEVIASMRITPSQSASRDLSAALGRLTSAFVEFEYTRRERGAGVVTDIFQGHLVTRREGVLTVHCYPPPSSTYYLLLSRRLFELQGRLGETATSVLLWLCFQHRGRRTSEGFRHRERLELTPRDTEGMGVVRVRPGHRLEAYRRVLDALEVLQRAGVVQLSRPARAGVGISLNKKRLQVQPSPPRRGLDRSLAFVVGELSDAERRKLRGAVFAASSRIDAQRQFADFLAMAKKRRRG